MYNMQIQDMDTYMYLCIHICTHYVYYMGVPGGSDGKESPCNAGDLSLIPRPGRYSRERNGYPLHYSYLKIPWTEEPGRLQSMGLQRLKHNWATNIFTFHVYYIYICVISFYITKYLVLLIIIQPQPVDLKKYNSEKMWVFRSSIPSMVEQAGQTWHSREYGKGIGKEKNVRKLGISRSHHKPKAGGKWVVTESKEKGFPVSKQTRVYRASDSRLGMVVQEDKQCALDMVYGL